MTDVRVATPQDEDGVMALCRQLHAENGTHAMNEEKVRGMIRRCIAQQGGLIGVIGEPEDLKGCICLLIDGVWFSDEYQLLELFNFVRADCRASDFARSLITYAKSCADGLGVDLTIGVISNVRMEAKVRLYGRLLPKAGEFFVYRPTAAESAEAA